MGRYGRSREWLGVHERQIVRHAILALALLTAFRLRSFQLVLAIVKLVSRESIRRRQPGQAISAARERLRGAPNSIVRAGSRLEMDCGLRSEFGRDDRLLAQSVEY